MTKLYKSRNLIIIDTILIVCSLLFAIYVLPEGMERVAVWGPNGLVVFLSLWYVISFAFRKYSVKGNLRVGNILWCNALIVLILMMIAYFIYDTLSFRDGTYYFFGLITVVEVIFYKGVRAVNRATDVSVDELLVLARKQFMYDPRAKSKDHTGVNVRKNYEVLCEERGKDVADYVSSIEDFTDPNLFMFGNDPTFVLKTFSDNYISSLINIRRLNNVSKLNELLRLANDKIEPNGHLVCCLELKNTRKKRLLSKYPKGVNWFFYILDFCFNRLGPKLLLTKRLYFSITKGYNRTLTYTEMLGRLYASGFELMNKEQFGDLHYLQLRKVAPVDRDITKNYSALIKLSRVAKGGQMINVYKMRTMHPYSEYIQAFVYDNNGTKTGDKIENDFRVNSSGRFFRKFWIDELPMFINFFKGEVKIVGVRPLSMHKYKTYPKELQEKRIKTKPGLVPPFYADMPKKEEELWSSEDRYLDSYLKHPIRTDWNYFWKAFHNIVVRKERSA